MKKNFIYTALCLFVLLFGAGASTLAQEENSADSEAFQEVYSATQEALEYDPFIQNGVYYSYPYYNAQGHPFLESKEFGTGSVDFRGKHYGGLSINYDLFSQQVILSWEYEGMMQMSLLAPEFLWAFRLKDKQFVKVELDDGTPAFFQLVAEAPGVACYYARYKERRELRDSGNRSIYSFSDQKSRHFLSLDGQLFRYKNNRSFIKLFPEAAREAMRAYTHDRQLQVMECSERDMEQLIAHASQVMNQSAKQKVE